jgi:hypothetical protein
MNITSTHVVDNITNKKTGNSFNITLPSYIDNVDNIYYDYIVVKPIGTECFIVADRPNIFRFYHTDKTNVFESVPFLTIHIPGLYITIQTLFLATLVRHNRCAIHDIIYPTNHNPHLTNEDRLHNMYTWFTKNPVAYTNDVCIFAISHILQKNTNITTDISIIPYPIKHIEYKSYQDKPNDNQVQYITTDINHIILSDDETTTNVSNIFTIYADIPPDIYRLYNDTNEYIGLAHIPDITTSIFMNNIFRKIKENSNLDLLEESDDEEEFENTAIDKFVYLQKNVRMKCIYNSMFDKWLPIKIIS